MTVKYDPNVIQEFADRLYSKAKSVIQSYTLLGAFLLGVGGLLTEEIIFVIAGIITGGVIGYFIGKEKAFEYKLQAQTALCQVQIEINSKE